MNLFDRLFTNKIEQLETIHEQLMIMCEIQEALLARYSRSVKHFSDKANREYPRYKFTVKTKARELKCQIVVGNPVTLATITSPLYTHYGYSVCKHGDEFDIEAGTKLAIKDVVESVGELEILSKEEKEIFCAKISEVLQKAREWNS